MLQEVLSEYHEYNHQHGHIALVYEHEGTVIGYTYYAPVPMTDATWTLWWIAVDKTTQSRGIGRELLRYAEDDVRQRGGRVLLIETSSVEQYDPTRQFY